MTVNDGGTWSYEEEGIMDIPDQAEPFHHIDRNTLTRVVAPSLNLWPAWSPVTGASASARSGTTPADLVGQARGR